MKKKHLLVAIALAFTAGTAFASPADDVMTPDIEKGEREFEFAYGADRNDAGKYESALELSYGAGITDRWATELGVEFERERGEHMKYSGFEWENRLGLIIDEDAPVTLGLLVERNWDVDAEDGDDEGDDEGDEEDDDRDLGAAGDDDDDGAEARTTLGYQWQVLYRHSHRLYYGMQGMGEMGQWDDWAKRDEQEHKIGPAIFGRLKTAGGQRLNYNAGLLFGVTDGTPDYTLRFKLEYEL